ncbi:hypothetical protein [Ferrovibrio sp.]|uniref:hypothetical protein n=1 Tax=Ferrovibrio sp. TaxID=1917215 RepID=UPI003D0CA26E
MPIRKCRLTSLLNDVRATIAFDQPKLSASLRDGQIYVDGYFRVLSGLSKIDAQGAMAEYQIEIVFNPEYPNIEPKVYEVGNAIARDAEHHINPDGSCCLSVWEAWTAYSRSTSIQEFFDGPLKNFFLGQYLKRTTGDWPFGEERHGKEGLLDAFADRLGCSRNEKKIRYLLRLLSKEWPRGHWNCPCGSGLIVRKCCKKELSELSERLPQKNAKRMLVRLRSYDRKIG